TNQHIGVSENAHRRRVDNDVVKHPAGFRDQARIGRARKQFGYVIPGTTPRQEKQPRWIETNDGLIQSEFTAKHFGKTNRGINPQIIGSAWLTQIAIDHEGSYAVGLG